MLGAAKEEVEIAGRYPGGSFSWVVLLSQCRRWLTHWLPVIVWMTLIFMASSDSESGPRGSRILAPLIRWVAPGLSATEVDAIVFFVRKVAHFWEYGVLAVLLLRALSAGQAGRWQWRTVGWALLGTAAYAASDEFHQAFVPTRVASITDVVIDTSGGAAALAVWWGVRRVMRWR